MQMRTLSSRKNEVESDSHCMSIELLGLRLDALTEKQTCDHILDSLERGEGGTLITANLDYLRRSCCDDEFGRFVKQSDLIVADGMPLIWASRLQGTPLPERVAGSSLCLSLSGELATKHRTVYLLGGNPGVAHQAAGILQDRYPGLEIAGTYCPQVGFEQDPEVLELIRQNIIDAQPNVLFVALGSPKTEKLIEMLRKDLPLAWWIGVGISLSFITGEVQRAPHWMQVSGTEWIHRLCQEQKRLGKRYLVDGIPFAMKLLTSSLLKRIRSSLLRQPNQE